MDYKELIRGAYDLHIHSAPDVMPRKMDDIDMAERIRSAGMAGYAIKNHFSSTCERAELMNKLYPDVSYIGTLSLNSTIGGLNPTAVEIAARAGAKLIWFPTWNSDHERAKPFDPNKKLLFWERMIVDMKKKGIDIPPISCVDENGELKKEVLDIIDIIAEHDIILATGHVSHEAAYKLVPEAAKRGIKKIVITHVDLPSTLYSIEDQKKFVECGAIIEHCYGTQLSGKCTFESVAGQIRAIGPENCIITTDLGKKTAMYPEEGMLEFCSKLYDAGFSEEEIKTMNTVNPRRLLNLE